MADSVLLVRDLAALRRRMANPSPMLARLYDRFLERLSRDAEFRRNHIFFPALLGDACAIIEAKGLIVALARNPAILAQGQSPASKATSRESLDGHIWCVAPRAMRLAVYFTWLDEQGAWSKFERRMVATAVLDFFYDYVVPVLRSRTPAGHNQQFSMTFCSAVAGHAFVDVDGEGARARALRDWAMPKFKQVLGLMPASGYSGEGSTYQSDVVSALAMWAGVFLEQLGDTEAWNDRHQPNGACLSDTLRLEAAMGSCGGLLPPWDHYGWSRIHNLAARTLWAGLSGNAPLLGVSEDAWDEESFIAWRDDDRLWTLVYWPDEGKEGIGHGATCSAPLVGWSLPAVGAAIEHLPRKLRVMSVWDRCSGGLQGVCRGQVNPNHLIVDLGGEPITADGWEDGRERLFSDESMARTLATLSPLEQEMICRQYGSLDKWVSGSQQGFLGQSCAIVVDGWGSYFPRQAREGRLVFEKRDSDRHTFTGEAAAYYQPAFDVTRMRRTISVNRAGVTWIVDDIRAKSEHTYAWRVWLRRGPRLAGPLGLRLDLPSGQAVTFAWGAESDGSEPPVTLAVTTVPTFPQPHGTRYPWTDEGSERCDLTVSGQRVRIVTCLIPEGVEGLTVRRSAPDAWDARWDGGADRFVLPPEAVAMPDETAATVSQPGGQHTVCDLDEPPFALLDGESDEALLAALDAAPVAEWRRTGAAMQTLTARGCSAAMPRIVALMEDARQNYTVHSVAAWCLGRARYPEALESLRRLSGIPEENTAARAQWAAARIEASLSTDRECR